MRRVGAATQSQEQLPLRNSLSRENLRRKSRSKNVVPTLYRRWYDVFFGYTPLTLYPPFYGYKSTKKKSQKKIYLNLLFLNSEILGLSSASFLSYLGTWGRSYFVCLAPGRPSGSLGFFNRMIFDPLKRAFPPRAKMLNLRKRGAPLLRE